MRNLLCIALVAALLALCGGRGAQALTQKTTEPQPMAAPGESTEPPHPRAAPVTAVAQHDLPRAGGILVFGGAHGTGLALVRTLVAYHEHVTVVTNAPGDDAAASAAGATVARADAMDPSTLKPLFASAPFRAVVSTLADQDGDANVKFAANKNIADAAKEGNVPRLVMLSSIGAGDSADALPWYVRLTHVADGSADTAALAHAESELKASDLDFTVIRAGGIWNRTPTGKAQLSPDHGLYSQIASSDLAGLIAGCIDDTSTIHKTLTAYDPGRVGFLAIFGRTTEPGAS